MSEYRGKQNTARNRTFFMHSQVDTSTTFIIYAYSLSVYSDLSRINSAGFEYKGDKRKVRFSSLKKKKKK